MLRSLVIGLGRAGADLHLAVLNRARDTGQTCFDERSIVACDPHRPGAGRDLPHVTNADTVADAARLVDPGSTVVHVCTPPIERAELLEHLAELGFRNLIVEKPLAGDLTQLQRIGRLRDRHELNLVVVAHWLHATLTRRLHSLVRERPLGELREITFAQHKPRFQRSLRTRGHPTAFDVELPHSLGVALALAGPAEVVGTDSTPMRCAAEILPHMGSARLELRHRDGVHTELYSDLTSPVQERSATLVFEHGSATAHYPLSENDDHAQLHIVRGGHREERSVFHDDALTTFMIDTYEHFRTGLMGKPPADSADFALHYETVRLLHTAKERCRTRRGPDLPSAPQPDSSQIRAGISRVS